MVSLAMLSYGYCGEVDEGFNFFAYLQYANFARSNGHINPTSG